MTTKAIDQTITRESILGLLTDVEVAKVSRAEGDRRLVEGDVYVDLEDIGSGIHEVQASSTASPRTALPRSAVSDATWAKIVRILAD